MRFIADWQSKIKAFLVKISLILPILPKPKHLYTSVSINRQYILLCAWGYLELKTRDAIVLFVVFGKKIRLAGGIMALTNKKMYEAITEIAGEEAIPIIDFLKNRKNISEFIIADKLKYDMQKTRNILYKLNNHNVALYIRKKDRQKGWYISYWTFHRKKVAELIDGLKSRKLDSLKERLTKEEANKLNFYICNSACARLDFDAATEYEFKCPECGSLLNLQDNLRTIENLKVRIKEIQSS